MNIMPAHLRHNAVLKHYKKLYFKKNCSFIDEEASWKIILLAHSALL